MYSQYVIFVALCCFPQPAVIKGARILAVIPTNSYSHQVNYRPILIELARRGHDLVVITTNPLNDPTIKNYTEIDVGHLFPALKAIDFVSLRWKMTWLDMSDILRDTSYTASETILSYPPVKKLYDHKTREKFDLFIVEFLWYHAIYGLSHIFECPIVGLSSLGLFNSMDDVMGLPPMASYPSNWEMGNLTGHHLPFWRRMYNFVIRTYDMYNNIYVHVAKHDQIAKKYFGQDFPYIEKIVKSTSLVLLNHHEVLQHPKLLIGKIVTLSGIYTSLNITQHVSSELKEIMEDATEGFIFVSFGSNVQSRNLPPRIKQIFIEVFSNLSHKVIWKYEDDTLPPLPSNIYIAKWFPQRAVLGHRNIKLFIYQGGLQSSEEAIMYGVPLVGIPVLADQDSVVARMVSMGVARGLEFTALTRENVNEAIEDVLYNNSYKENASKAQRFFKDRPYDSLQHAMWWIEYVIRNKGTPYHYYSIADDAWYKRYDEDVIATLAIVVFIITCLSVIILIKLFHLCRHVMFRAIQTPEKKLKSN